MSHCQNHFICKTSASDCRRVVLREAVLTRLVNRAILSGDVFISREGQILITEDEEGEEVRYFIRYLIRIKSQIERGKKNLFRVHSS